MKKFIIILFFGFCLYLPAYEGDSEISLNLGASTGTGFGYTYNLTDDFRIKLSTLPVYYTDSTFIIASAIALSLDIKKLNDGISSVYLLVGGEYLLSKHNGEDGSVSIYSLGTGMRKFIDENMFLELELGFAFFYTGDFLFNFVTGSVNFGYRF